MRAGRGEYNLRCCYGPKAAATVQKKTKEVHYRSLRRNFPLGKMQAPGEDEGTEGESGLGG